MGYQWHRCYHTNTGFSGGCSSIDQFTLFNTYFHWYYLHRCTSSKRRWLMSDILTIGVLLAVVASLAIAEMSKAVIFYAFPALLTVVLILQFQSTSAYIIGGLFI